MAARVQTLPPKLAQITLDFLALTKDGADLPFTDYQKRNAFDQAAQSAFNAISGAEFEQVSAVWFPQFAKAAKAALERPSSYKFNNTNPPSYAQQIEQAKNWCYYSRQYDQPLEWIAQYSAYEWSLQYFCPPLLLAAIEQGNEEIFQIMLAAAKNEHPITASSDIVLLVLAQSSRVEGWELLEKLLIAAQRQEGLRQSILSKIGAAHPPSQVAPASTDFATRPTALFLECAVGAWVSACPAARTHAQGAGKCLA